jgi:hypothetical protein
MFMKIFFKTIFVFLLFVPFSYPSAKLSLEAFPTSLSSDGKSRSLITITAERDGKPVDGEIVQLSTTLGDIQPSATLSNGKATAYLRSSQTGGIATITAKWQEQEAKMDVYINTYPAIITVEPASRYLPADGESSTFLEVKLFRGLKSEDEKHPLFVPAEDGTLVSWKTDHGTITPYSTTKNGRAIAKLTSDNFIGDVRVSAKIGDSLTGSLLLNFMEYKFNSLTLSAYLQNLPSATNEQIKVLASPSNKILINAILKSPQTPESYFPLAFGVPINFETSLGEIEPLYPDLSLGKNIILTRSGVASAILSSDKPGKAIVTATYGDLKDTIEIEFLPPVEPKLIKLMLPDEFLTYPEDYIVCHIHAMVLGPSDEPVPMGTPVYFSASSGYITPVAFTLKDGTVDALYVFKGKKGEVEISARAGNAEARDFLVLDWDYPFASHFEYPKEMEMDLHASDFRPLTNGESQCDLWIYVRDKKGMPVTNGLIELSAHMGDKPLVVEPPFIYLRESNWRKARVIFPPGRGEAEIKAAIGKLSKSIKVEFGEEECEDIEIEGFPNVFPSDGKSYGIIRVYLKGKEGKEVAIRYPTSLSYNLSKGTLIPWSLSGPWASLIIKTPPTPSIGKFRASYKGMEKEKEIIYAGKPKTMQLMTNASKFEKGEKAYLKAIVKDENGYPVPDGTEVKFELNKGKVFYSTTQDGEAIISIPMEEAGEYGIQAICGEAKASISLLCE